LARLGYTVVAVTGKPELTATLQEWGAARILARDQVVDESAKPLLAGKWAAAVDTVGGQTLTTLVREMANYGVVAACGLVGGTELPLSVYPFILRGVTLAGIGSAALPYDRRLEIWRKLSDTWRLANLDSLATTISLSDVEPSIQQILAGKVVGRTVVAI
ncbi:MAG: zinc-binding dehydrogenase, partial [Pirellulaceae bacterium]|nr:zinc-binding dehydrogenase [Pirellulaceae bacterium]